MTETPGKSRLPRTGTLLVVAVLLLIGGGALMVWWPSHRNQRALAHFEKLGGSVTSVIDHPSWIPESIDDEDLWLFERVQQIVLRDVPVGGAGLEPLAGLTHLEKLWLLNVQVNDKGLEHLAGLTELETLYISNARVGDAGLDHLKGLTNLRFLMFINTDVTEAGIDDLQRALPDCHISWIP